MFGPYYRVGDAPEVVRKIVQSQELWGLPRGNTFQSEFPKAKAYVGSLPESAKGFEFLTDVPPDVGCTPFIHTWSNGPKRPGVIVRDGYARIKVQVTKETVLS